MIENKTAGEISQKLLADPTKYDAREVGHALTDNIMSYLWESIRLHYNVFDEKEFCVVMLIAEDPLIKTAKRRKFYCWPYLPSPRPNQAVFLYNKCLDKITKRLWILPSAMVMAELASLQAVAKPYQTMQAWSIAFLKGTFWEYIRYEHDIDMLSEHEYLLAHRDELIKSGCKVPEPGFTEPFDFSKISIKKVIDA